MSEKEIKKIVDDWISHIDTKCPVCKSELEVVKSYEKVVGKKTFICIDVVCNKCGNTGHGEKIVKDGQA